MKRKEIFTFRINEDERRMLEALANYLQRTQGDTVRLLIREAAKSLEIGDAGQGARGKLERLG